MPVVLVLILATPVPSPRVPVAENFSDAELIGLFALATATLTAGIFQRPITEARDPLFGGPPSFDRRVSEELYRGPDAGPFLRRVPDIGGGIVAPALTLGAYGLDGFAAHFGRPIGGRHADHELLALVEAYVVTLSLTQAAKLSIGRVRPEYELGRRQDTGDDPERTLSFWSGHSASSFCLAAFVSRDVGDWLTRGGHGPVTARVLPSLLFYGAAGLVAYSRLVDQKHYLSDVTVGTLVGAAGGNLIYALHFDGEGRPRRRHPGRLKFLAFPGGVSLIGSF
jgi:membrane-associated phospholipid phosphatase